MATTPTKKEPTASKNGNEGTTKATTKTSLEEEAKKFTQKKKPKRLSPLTSRKYFAGMFGAALMINSKGLAPWAEIRRTAYELADYMLEDE